MWVSYAVVATAIAMVGGIGGKATDIGPWYRDLTKPSWNPPDWAFPVVWTTIYILIIASVGRTWNAADPAEQAQIVWVVAINFALNALWSVLFFSMRKPLWALVEVLLLWLSIIAMIWVVGNISILNAVLLIPYIVWVSIAMLLNLSIVRLNPQIPTNELVDS